MRRTQAQPRRILLPLSGEDAAGRAKGPIDRIGHFVIGRLDQAS
jgi:hypothetical protein